MRCSTYIFTLLILSFVSITKAEGIKDSLNYSQLSITTAFPRVDPMMNKLDSLTTFAFSKDNEYFGNLTTTTTPYNPNYSDEQIKKKLAQIPALFPMSFNSDVKTYINYFTQVKRGYTSRMLGLGDVYFPMFEEYIDKMKLPTELKYLPIIESAFNPVAQSKAGATGMWQIMYKTGRMLGLDMNSYIDERMDPRLSTEAGLAYLQQLYGIYGDWQLALAAYNCGPGNVNKAIANAGGVKNFWAIKPFLPMETQNYVPSFIGVVYAMTYHDDYKIAATRPIFNPTFIDTVMIQDRVSLQHISNVIGIPKDEISFLNPSLKLGIIPSSEKGFALRLPIGYLARFESNRITIMNDPSMIMEQPVATTTEDVWVTVPKILTHVVKKGETLASIAKKYAVEYADIKKWNKLKSSSLWYGQKLTIKSEVTKKVTQPVPSTIETTNANSTYSPPKTITPNTTTSVVQPAKTTIETWESVPVTKYHIVKSGETLSGIASQYNVTLAQIKAWNKLSSTNLLKGQKLAIKTTEKKKVIKTIDTPVTVGTSASKYNADDNITLTPEESRNMPSTGIKYALHTVQKGETIASISSLYAGSSEEGIKTLNNLSSAELKIGTTLKVPLQ